jgi:hypothetical protein
MREQTYAIDPLDGARQTLGAPDQVSLQHNRRIQEVVLTSDPLAGERRDTLGGPDFGPTVRR